MLNTLVHYLHVHKGLQSVLFVSTDGDVGVTTAIHVNTNPLGCK